MPKGSRRREEYEIEFTDEDVLKVRFDRVEKKVIQFSVQYLALIEGEWRPIVRMDTAHAKAHMDTIRPDSTKTTTDLAAQNYNEALTWSINEVKRRWEFYLQRYERWLK